MNSAAIVNEATARRAVFDYASTAAEAWTEELERFGALWRSFNEQFFDGALDEPHISIGSPTSPKAAGEFHRIGGDGLRSLILIRRTHVDGTFNRGKVPLPGQTVRYFREDHGLEFRWRHLADILLHEQIHQAQYQLGTPSKTKHDVDFAAMCNAVGDQLGLRHVVSRRRKGDPNRLPIAANWPFNVRPKGYYGDLWGELFEPDQVEDWLSQILALWEAGDPPHQLEFLQRIGVIVSCTVNCAANLVADDAGSEPTTATNDVTPVHDRIKAARLARGWSKRELAEAAGTQQPIISKIENGRLVDDALMARVAAVLEISVHG
jgi:DNA-binding XRE family transcriptional regulator